MGWELLAAARNTKPAQAKDTLQSSQLMGWELLAAAMNTVDLIHRRLEISPLENV